MPILYFFKNFITNFIIIFIIIFVQQIIKTILLDNYSLARFSKEMIYLLE